MSFWERFVTIDAQPFQMAYGYLMIIPENYKKATIEEKKKYCNGCGADGWKGKLVPDTVYGLSIRECCNIHDWEYNFNPSKERADKNFLYNMRHTVNRKGGFLKYLRLARVWFYYRAVCRFGDEYYIGPKLG